MSEVERLRAALQRIADEYGDCRCEHDDEHCCALVTDYCCPACIAAVALRETLPAAPPAPTAELLDLKIVDDRTTRTECCGALVADSDRDPLEGVTVADFVSWHDCPVHNPRLAHRSRRE